MVRVINVSRDCELGQNVEIAEGFFGRLRGLIGRKGWGETDGLWIEPCAGVHAFGMGFAIDVILVDEGMRTLWLQTVRPWRMGRVHIDARAALELPVGTIERTGTQRGDQIRLERAPSAGDERVS